MIGLVLRKMAASVDRSVGGKGEIERERGGGGGGERKKERSEISTSLPGQRQLIGELIYQQQQQQQRGFKDAVCSWARCSPPLPFPPPLIPRNQHMERLKPLHPRGASTPLNINRLFNNSPSCES